MESYVERWKREQKENPFRVDQYKLYSGGAVL